MIVLGCDPGAAGAFVIVDTDRPALLAVLDMPMLRLGPRAYVDGARVLDWLDSRQIDACAVEEVGAMPKQGVSSMCQFGRADGGAVSLMLTLGAPLRHVSPRKWKQRAGLIGRPKLSALDVARVRFGPLLEFSRKKDLGRADAALIALYSV